MITKKHVLLFCFLSVSFAVFSQKTIENDDKKTIDDNTSSQKDANRVSKPTEKIQTTDNGVVIHQQDYKPQYPTPMILPKSEPSVLVND